MNKMEDFPTYRNIKSKTRQIIGNIASVVIANMKLCTPGLMHGRAGGIYFLYAASEYLADQSYRVPADQQVMEITDNLNAWDVSFSTGVSGIGWLLNHVNDAGYLEIEDEELFFNEIELLITQAKTPISYEKDSLNSSLYSAQVLLRNRYDATNEIMVNALDRVCEHLLFIERHRLLRNFGEVEDLGAHIGSLPDLFATLEHISRACLASSFLIAVEPLEIKKDCVNRMLKYYFAKIKMMLGYYPLATFRMDGMLSAKDLQALRTSFFGAFGTCSKLSQVLGTKMINLEYYKHTFLRKTDFRTRAPKLSLSNDYLELLSILKVPGYAASDILLFERESLVNGLALHTEHDLLARFTANETEANIGLEGLAGLGLSIVESCYGEIPHWKSIV